MYNVLIQLTDPNHSRKPANDLPCCCLLVPRPPLPPLLPVSVLVATNSMAWLEKDVARFIKFCAPHLMNFAACEYGASWQKSWLLACSYISMSSLGTVCNHPKNSHEVIAGQMDDGTFRSRKTAEYPALMCSAIAKLISPLCQSQSTILDLASTTGLIPKRGPNDFPVS